MISFRGSIIAGQSIKYSISGCSRVFDIDSRILKCLRPKIKSIIFTFFVYTKAKNNTESSFSRYLRFICPDFRRLTDWLRLATVLSIIRCHRPIFPFPFWPKALIDRVPDFIFLLPASTLTSSKTGFDSSVAFAAASIFGVRKGKENKDIFLVRLSMQEFRFSYLFSNNENVFLLPLCSPLTHTITHFFEKVDLLLWGSFFFFYLFTKIPPSWTRMSSLTSTSSPKSIFFVDSFDKDIISLFCHFLHFWPLPKIKCALPKFYLAPKKAFTYLLLLLLYPLGSISRPKQRGDQPRKTKERKKKLWYLGDQPNEPGISLTASRTKYKVKKKTFGEDAQKRRLFLSGAGFWHPKPKV